MSHKINVRWFAAFVLTALALGVAPAALAAQPSSTSNVSSGPALVDADGGTATFCLTPDSAAALTAAGLTMTATAPAQIVTDPATRQSCVSEDNLTAKVALDLSGGGFAYPGAIVFTRAKDGKTLTLSDMSVRFGLPGRLSGSLDGNPADQVVFATFNVVPANVNLNPLTFVLSATAPLAVSPAAVSAFQQTFGASPWTAGSQIFAAAGHGTVHVPALAPIRQLLTSFI